MAQTNKMELKLMDRRVMERYLSRGELAAPDIQWIMFDPARLGKQLAKFALRHADDAPAGIENDAAGA